QAEACRRRAGDGMGDQQPVGGEPADDAEEVRGWRALLAAGEGEADAADAAAGCLLGGQGDLPAGTVEDVGEIRLVGEEAAIDLEDQVAALEAGFSGGLVWDHLLNEHAVGGILPEHADRVLEVLARRPGGGTGKAYPGDQEDGQLLAAARRHG